MIKELIQTKKGIIFDLDGTLTLSQQFHYEAYATVFREYGITYTRSEDAKLYGGQGSEKIFPQVFAKRGKPLRKSEIQKLVDRKREIYSQMIETRRIEVVPGIKEFAESLKKQGKKIIVATGNRLNSAKIILKRTKLDSFFPDIVSIEEVEKEKPAPDIFLEAVKRCELTPAECLVFEDAINGIQAAKAANIDCVALTTQYSEEKLQEAGAKIIIKDYTELSS